jgi:hypothetical protein
LLLHVVDHGAEQVELGHCQLVDITRREMEVGSERR